MRLGSVSVRRISLVSADLARVAFVVTPQPCSTDEDDMAGVVHVTGPFDDRSGTVTPTLDLPTPGTPNRRTRPAIEDGGACFLMASDPAAAFSTMGSLAVCEQGRRWTRWRT
jgi:hypothetical protein